MLIALETSACSKAFVVARNNSRDSKMHETEEIADRHVTGRMVPHSEDTPDFRCTQAVVY